MCFRSVSCCGRCCSGCACVKALLTIEAVSDTKDVAVWMYMYNDRQPAIPETYPPPLRHLMEACWKAMPVNRVSFQEIAPALTALCAAHDKLVDNVPEPQTYDDWLAALGLADKKEALAEYFEDGAELRDLKQMDEGDLNDDILGDDDLGLDEDAKEAFKAAVGRLKAGEIVAISSDTDRDIDTLMLLVNLIQRTSVRTRQMPWMPSAQTGPGLPTANFTEQRASNEPR